MILCLSAFRHDSPVAHALLVQRLCARVWKSGLYLWYENIVNLQLVVGYEAVSTDLFRAVHVSTSLTRTVLMNLVHWNYLGLPKMG